jgi:hypothetical protein
VVDKVWSFQWLKKQCGKKGWFAPMPEEDWIERLRKHFLDNALSAHSFSKSISRAFDPNLLTFAVSTAETDRNQALERIHLYVRVQLFGWFVYIKRLDDLVEQLVEKKVKRIAIGSLEWFDVQKIATLAASAFVVGIDDAAEMIADHVIRYKNGDTPATKIKDNEPDVFEWFMIELICKWKGVTSSIKPPFVKATDVFHRIIDNWDSDISQELTELCDLHAKKLLSIKKSDNDLIIGLNYGLLFYIPVEILFIHKIRRLQGKASRLPSHYLLDSPLISTENYPSSGYDEVLQAAMDHCDLKSHNIQIPWEDRFQKLPPREWQNSVKLVL